MFIFIWALFKNASLPWSLRTAEQAMVQNGFDILDPAGNQNVHVMGHKSNPEVFVTVVCQRLGQSPTSIVIHAISPDQAAANVAAARVRDHIRQAVSLEGDVVANPVHE